MKTIGLAGWLIFAGGAAAAFAAEPGARKWFQEGLNAFAASNYPAATNAFGAAARAAPREKLDPAAAHFNAGLAIYALGNAAEAAEAFRRAAAASDLALQARAYYNRGNSLLREALQPLGGAGAAAGAAPGAAPTATVGRAVSTLGEAIQMYENAILLDPHDEAAKINYELAQQIRQQLQQQLEQQAQAQPEPTEKESPSESAAEEESPDGAEPESQPQPAESPSVSEAGSEDKGQPPPDKPSEQMTPEEAVQLLDVMKAQEQSQRDRLHPFFGRPVPVEKDW